MSSSETGCTPTDVAVADPDSNTPLTDAERAARDEKVQQVNSAYEAVRRNARTLAAALLFIVRNRLFRDHDSFGAFVEAHCEFSADLGNKHVRWARLNECLVEAGEEEVEVESHGRAVTSLLDLSPGSDHVTEENKGRAVEAVRLARKAAASEGARLTANHFADARLRIGGGRRDPQAADSALWSEEVRERLYKKVPRAYRADVEESLVFASLSEDITPEMVDEALEVVRAERDAPTGRKGWPVVVGVAKAVVELNRRQLVQGGSSELLRPQLPHKLIVDLDILGDDYLVPADAKGYTPAPGAPRPPLLVVIPTGLCPDALFDAHPGARETAEGRAEVIVEINELESFGGPFLDTLDEHGHRMLDIRKIRKASKAAGIRKVLHPAGPGIEWAMWAVNCCTGCSHGCSRRFCYASDFALLYFPQAFVPTIWPARLDAFENSDPPDLDRQPEHLRVWSRTVFHGSMTDLMNRAFPKYWIQAVIGAIAGSPKWRVVVLTKLAPRLTDFVWPANAVVGVTVTGPKEVRAAAKALGALKGEAEKWISAEPYLERFDPSPLIEAGATFFACGAQTATRWAGEIQPSAKDVLALLYAVVSAGAYFFPKDNLDFRGHIPAPGYDPYDGWSPPRVDHATANEPELNQDTTLDRRPVRPKGPPTTASL